MGLLQEIEFAAEHLPGWRDDPDRPRLRSWRQRVTRTVGTVVALP